MIGLIYGMCAIACLVAGVRIFRKRMVRLLTGEEYRGASAMVMAVVVISGAVVCAIMTVRVFRLSMQPQ